ncbi:YbjN domain-containing protein [Corynebacterium uberis]|uniref:YbjN domain-containing protein n=1 Tax=Corynebacterium TaxID=1716 RepID=UPI0022BA5A7A|nr:MULTISPECIES: YbjN domain-containing protein [Corynebacterium]
MSGQSFLPGTSQDLGAFWLVAGQAPAGWQAWEAVWAGQLDARDYVRAVAVANALNGAQPWPGVRITGAGGSDVGAAVHEQAAVEARARVVHPEPRDAAQSQALWSAAVTAGRRLAREMAAQFPDREVPALRRDAAGSSDAPDGTAADPSPAAGITRERVAAWFEQRGIAEVPFDEEAQVVALSLEGTAVDIDVSDPAVLSVRLCALVPGAANPDPGRLVHLANRANARHSLPTSTVISQDGGWWVASQVVVPAGAGLDDAQVDTAIHDAVLAGAAQLRSVMHRL